MYIIKLYNNDNLIIDIIGDFEEYEEAEQWLRDYAHDDQYGRIIDIKERK